MPPLAELSFSERHADATVAALYTRLRRLRFVSADFGLGGKGSETEQDP